MDPLPLNVPLRDDVNDTVWPASIEVVDAEGVVMVTVCAKTVPAQQTATRKNKPFKRVEIFIAQSFIMNKRILNKRP